MPKESFRFKILEDPEIFSQLAAEWECLTEELANYITVFSSYTWYQSWWRSFGADAKLHLFTMWQGDRLVGIAPLMLKKYSLHCLPVRTVGFIQNNQSLHNDFIVMPEYRTLFLEKMIQSLFELSSGWDLLYFRNISLFSENYKSLTELLDSEGSDWKQVSNIINSPFLIPAGNWENYLADRSRKTRKNLKNIRNKIRNAGNASVKHIRTWEDFLACKKDIFELARQSWSENVGDSLGSSTNINFFVSLAYEAASKGWLSVWALYLDGRMIAIEFHLKAYGKEHAIRGHYHPEFASLSPGTYLEMVILEHVFQEQEGVNVYDFCGAFDTYKKKWTDTYVPHCDIYVFKDQIYSKISKFHEFKIIPSARLALQYAKRLLQRG